MSMVLSLGWADDTAGLPPTTSTLIGAWLLAGNSFENDCKSSLLKPSPSNKTIVSPCPLSP